VNLTEMSGFDALYVGIGTIAPFANAVSLVVTLIVDTNGIVPPYGQIRTSPFEPGVTIVTFSDTAVAVEVAGDRHRARLGSLATMMTDAAAAEFRTLELVVRMGAGDCYY
jgi:hypothetical protein